MNHFQQLSEEDALNFVRDSPAFRGDFMDWVSLEICQGEAKTFVTQAPPAKMHRKIVTCKVKTKVSFSISTRQGVRLRFKDGRRSPIPCKFEDLTEEAVVLVVDTAPTDGVQVKVDTNDGANIINENVAKGLAGKSIFIWTFKVIDPADMVGWYDPGQLAQTAVEVGISTIFGRNADFRATEALATPEPDDAGGKVALEPTPAGFFDYGGTDSMWMDYVADTGDGWDSTYAVAYAVSQPQLKIENVAEPLPRGDVLVFGGDEVYPTSSRPVYKQRLIDPYEAALPNSNPPHPRVFAIPGNHDWYDSLVSFTRLFCQRRWFAGWKTRQTRSYFALRLPQHWWLIGTDVQLDSDIDYPQVKYFKAIAKEMKPEDRVILCTAEPHWIYDKLLKKYDSEINENNLAFLEEKIFCRKVEVFISGDLHHYRRHSTDDNRHKITAGGGGGFLHPTHGSDVSELRNHFELKEAFPKPEESKRLTRRNLGFLFLNPLFGVATAILYMLTSWSVMADLSGYKYYQVWPALKAAISASVVNPTAVFWILAVWGGFLLFTDTYSRWYRAIAGTLHGLTHVLATFFIGWFATWVSMQDLALFRIVGGPWAFKEAEQLVVAGAIIFVLGWLAGSFVMGIYLYISLNWFKRHANEAFSALSIPDWKNFLRIRIDKDALTIYPVGIRRVPRKWKPGSMHGGSIFLPDDPKATSPELIDGPIIIPAVPKVP